MSVRRFKNEGASVSKARRFAVDTLAGAPREVIQVAELMVSELATNCVRHGGGEFRVCISRAGEAVRFEVTDGAGGEPAIRSPSPSEPTGRGLRIVEALSREWGVEYLRPGKTVWFTLDAPAGEPVGEGDAPAAASLARLPEKGPSIGSDAPQPARSRDSRRLHTRRSTPALSALALAAQMLGPAIGWSVPAVASGHNVDAVRARWRRGGSPSPRADLL